MDILKVGSQFVYGIGLTEWGGCLHYHSPLDIIAVHFLCCHRYYACYECHCSDHLPLRWSLSDLSQKAILCCRCGNELSLGEYLNKPSHCPSCLSLFNPKCKNHWHLYFAIKN